MLVAALSAIAKPGKQPTCTRVGGIYTMELLQWFPPVVNLYNGITS